MKSGYNNDYLALMGKDYTVIKEHPYPDLLPVGVKILVIGSFPSNAAKNFNYFYGSKLNRFWHIISEVYSHEFKFQKGLLAAEEREDFLRINKIGLTDMINQCYRYKNGSTDESIFPISLKDILAIMDEHSTISRLVFTGRQYINGPLGLFITLLHQNDMELEGLCLDDLKIPVGIFDYRGHKIEIMAPYSPSATFAQQPDYDFQHVIKMYKRCLSL